MESRFPLSGKKCISKPRHSRKRPGCIRLFVCPTTGGRLEISVSPRESILGLKTALARKLKTNPARITLIFKEKALTSGRLIDYQIPEDSHLTLLPNMESGLSLHQSEKSITQALENLSETQVNDFLSGRAPLMLAIRMGENMVFVQLQLSTAQGQGQPQGQGSPQPRSSVTPMTPRTATLLSQSGLSASALAQATRCLSRRIHHLQGMGRTSSATNPMALNATPIPRTAVPMVNTRLPSSSQLSSTSSPSPDHMIPSSPVMMTASAPVPSPAPHPPSATTPRPSGPSLLQLPTSTPVPPNLSSTSSSLPSPPPSPGAVINSLKHVGSGVYSGTFSGTLDPSLQESNGQPRKSVRTILHILNDLLVASPHSPRPPASPQPASPAPSHPTTHQQQHFFNQNAILTPPPSPKLKDNAGSFVTEKADNELLRGKMQRVQMMLAQRKEQRGKRRQAVAPYPAQVNNLAKVAACDSLGNCPFSTNSSAQQPSPGSASMTTTPATSLPSSTPTSERPRICSHVEDGGECCSSYGKKGIEHDSLVV